MSSPSAACAMVPPAARRPCQALQNSIFWLVLAFGMDAAAQKRRGDRRRCKPGQRQQVRLHCPFYSLHRPGMFLNLPR